MEDNEYMDDYEAEEPDNLDDLMMDDDLNDSKPANKESLKKKKD
jgi:hypothetical protein